MLKALYLFPAGIFCHALLPRIPPAFWLYSLLAFALAAVLFTRRLRLAGVFLAGLALGALWAGQQLALRLPESLDKTDVTVTGTVNSLVIGDDRRAVFELGVDNILSRLPQGMPAPETLRLSWYGEPSIAPGERWQLRVRLRSPRGFSNPGGFDYSGWLLSRGISATGYVRDNRLNRRIAPAPFYSLSRFRDRLLMALRRYDGADDNTRGLMAALILGEQALIPRETFDRLKLTGTVHLVVVSGLHIGMVAGLGFFLGLGAGRIAAAAGAGTPARVIAVPFALCCAGAYSLLAGFDLPVQRALIMSAAALAALAMRRAAGGLQLVGLALTAVALIDPLAVLSSGFWLSFMAVAGLVMWFTCRPAEGRMRQLLIAQVVVFVCLAPWLIYFQGNVSLWALPVNLLAISWVGLAIVPFCLAGALLQVVPELGNPVWWLAAVQLDWFAEALARIDRLSDGSAFSPLLSLPSGNRPVWWALMVVSLLFLLPGGLPRAVPIAVLVAALGVTRLPVNPLEATVLDVGQGLAVVVRAGGKTLVYDAGPGFPSGFNTGDAVVTPYLKTLGVDEIDVLVVSHGDRDHAGGVEGLIASIPAAGVFAGQPDAVTGAAPQRCGAGIAWRWGEVRFRFLWPPKSGAGSLMGNDNNHSCVLLVTMGAVRILLPGDIEKAVERKLIAAGGLAGGDSVDLLVAPHHGSKTSSSRAFVQALKPDHLVFPAGFNHHFGHPHPLVEARYRRAGSTVWKTAQSGAIRFRWDSAGRLAVSEHRRHYRRYWH